MSQIEKEEIQALPGKYRPLGAWSYFWLSILYAVPTVGLVFLIIHSISKANINRRNFARSFFCIYVLVAIIVAVLVITGGAAGLLSSLQ